MDLEKPYTIIDLVQGSQDWLDARKSYITASQVPCIIMDNEHPYQNARQLFDEKVHGIEIDNSGKAYIFKIGHEVEERSRGLLLETDALNFTPIVLVSKKVPNFLASLDGIEFEKNIILETKSVSMEKLGRIYNDIIQEDHYLQMQSQMLASGIDRCLYFAMNHRNNSFIKKEIKAKKSVQEKIESAVKSFWDKILKKEY